MKAYLENLNFYLPMKSSNKYMVYLRVDMHLEPKIIVCRVDFDSSYYETVFAKENEVDYHRVLKLMLDTIFGLDKRHATHHLARLYELYGKMGDHD